MDPFTRWIFDLIFLPFACRWIQTNGVSEIRIGSFLSNRRCTIPCEAHGLMRQNNSFFGFIIISMIIMVNTNLYNQMMKIQRGGGVSTNLSKLLFEKKELLVMTFANLIVQTLITFYAMKKYSTEKKNRSVNIFIWIFSFFIIILLVIPMPIWIKFLLFCVFSYGCGYSLSNVADADTLHYALMGTLSIFGIMFSIGFMMILFGIRLGITTGIILFFSLLGFILATLFSPTNSILTTIGIVLFSIYIIYDTNNILQKNYYGDFITASLDYYLDILNLFSLMSRDQ